MSFKDHINKLLIYEEPQQHDPFELLDNREEAKKKPAKTTKDSSVPRKPSLGRKLLHWLQKDKEQIQQENGSSDDQLSKKLHTNLEKIKHELNVPINEDVVIREFKILGKTEAFLVHIEGMANQSDIDNYILRQLLAGNDVPLTTQGNLVNYIINNLLATNQVTLETSYAKVLKQILNGHTALFIDEYTECVLIGTTKYEKRSVSTPLQELVVYGPQEAFVEDLRTNITLIRRIIRNKNLVTEIIAVSKDNNMKCGILYIKDIINPEIVQEIKRRIKGIDLDFISDGVLAQLIEDHPNAILPLVLSTERPDRVAAFLTEGRAAIILDGTPLAIVVPMTFFHFFRTAEDYTLRWQYSTFLRIVRTLAIVLALFLPGLYIALTLYHQEALPTGFLSSLITTRQNLPFPAIIELLLMEFSWEIIREAGIRVPGVVGQTLGIIGGVILGQAAVEAGLVSPVLIIIVAIAGLGNFSIPNFAIAFGVRILRFAFLLLGALAGFYGITVGIIILGGLACSMKSFGVPYFAPIAPKTKGASIFYTKPVWERTKRPDVINPQKEDKKKGKSVRQWIKEDEREGRHDS